MREYKSKLFFCFSLYKIRWGNEIQKGGLARKGKCKWKS